MNIDADSLQRTHKICQLVTIASNDTTSQDFAFVEKQIGYLQEAKNIEQSIRNLIQKYMQLGDSKKSTYYFAFLNSSEKSTDEASIESECRALLDKRNEDKNLKAEILSNTLSYEKIESNYEEYIETKKGMRIIENAFVNFKNKQEPERAIDLFVMLKRTYQWAGYEHEDLRSMVCQTIYNKISEYHSNNDYIGALKLLDAAPDYIYDDNEISSTYAHWLANSAIKNHSQKYHCDDWAGDYTAYVVDEYVVALDSNYENDKELSTLNIIKTTYWDFSKNTQAEYSALKHLY